MRIRLVFADLANDLFEALALIRLEEVEECDAPSRIISTFHTNRFEVHSINPEFALDLAIDIPDQFSQLVLFVKVEALNADAQKVSFINTTEIRLEDGVHDELIAKLEQVS